MTVPTCVCDYDTLGVACGAGGVVDCVYIFWLCLANGLLGFENNLPNLVDRVQIKAELADKIR